MSDGGCLIQERFNVDLPGIERDVAQNLVEGAHRECPYSKATHGTHGTINVVTNVIEAAPTAHVA